MKFLRDGDSLLFQARRILEPRREEGAKVDGGADGDAEEVVVCEGWGGLDDGTE
jgi:hypothetical protein